MRVKFFIIQWQGFIFGGLREGLKLLLNKKKDQSKIWSLQFLKRTTGEQKNSNLRYTASHTGRDEHEKKYKINTQISAHYKITDQSYYNENTCISYTSFYIICYFSILPIHVNNLYI